MGVERVYRVQLCLPPLGSNGCSSSHHRIIILFSRKGEIKPFFLSAPLNVAYNIAAQILLAKLSHMAIISPKEAGKYNLAFS